jgi:hypothetical protein
MSVNGPCCAHITVKYNPIENPDGTYSDRWLCLDCLTPFRPVPRSEPPNTPSQVAVDEMVKMHNNRTQLTK